ncbi:hypothetical protein KZ820_11350 [Sphingomonas sp. RRHST34]|uniref:Uncharacterized protein n=1 Tax=Sphingomonas citri TaxID=2862499 RepID=A0ABS7BNY3_9SPHN|nr:hypothetical protein [Sphingomonas citri]MBW6531331.1 hypothetical protein [Sphingomonas citri]
MRRNLKDFMGRDAGGTAEIYAVDRFDTVRSALENILAEIDVRAPGACAENAPKSSYPALKLRA